jgi:uncharacterized membrane protein
MNSERGNGRRLDRMESLLVGLLRYGAIVACIWLTIGMVLSTVGGAWPARRFCVLISERCLAIGIVLLIALPVLRVALTMGVFVFEKDYVFAVISGVVLLIITVGFLVGVSSTAGALRLVH